MSFSIEGLIADVGDLAPGDFVLYTGATDEQVNWGSCYDPRGILTINEIYLLERVNVHTWHTKIFLAGIDSQQGFNSASFKKVNLKN